ncbi:MAG: type I DNA topoisomerase [Candidatus Harrisonbacteria bacterium CG10_big_fil_rev_8_21_14_0_10_42_17]|uniref:DNA topoisomerase 1 n=1 Tax=Candidatus Harrisonbacteria bacterium CG10_big_fil_rev_8_21_14_0_10_42_17 TaxID=1974584 RepID=A0A2M6WIE7_9BACT|nr:MAG: type I DNA topoisomerase [Candidatus Harrisonbacteria bacterium CG10_big_fil_rev_8_21_14_0_10_42_17]
MNLIIVESPTKAKTISKFLGKEYHVESSYGHIRDLPKSQFGIDVENNFEPKYIIPTKSRKAVTALKKIAAKSDEVILATDEDREGEAIAWHLLAALDLDVKKTKRIVFHEITKTAIEEALKNPRMLDERLVDAQQARRVLDRIVGYKLSPFLWKKVAKRLSAGRVQSVALRLIVDREHEIRKFKPEEYWSINALLKPEQGNENDVFESTLAKINGETLDKFHIKNGESAQSIKTELEHCKYTVQEIKEREASKNPLPPFITSTLQQESAKRLGYSAKKTMLLAQRLYESGRITYMRTDSVNLSAESLTATKAWLRSELGEQYAGSAPRVFKSKSKLAQEAHEAIRPTRVTETPKETTITDAGEKKVYTLIWERLVASQMPPAKIATTTIEIGADKETSNNPKYLLKTSGQRIIFDGYLKIWKQKIAEKEVPKLTNADSLHLVEIQPSQHFTEPPPRYSEATLIKTLEEHSIGRPSTYAPTISVIQVRNYVEKEQGRFKPTEIGEAVNEILTEHFPTIVDIDFTAKVEDEFDMIANGKGDWHKVIEAFYTPFIELLEKKYETVEKSKIADVETGELCEKCGKPMIIKFGRFGKFMACSGFPECKNAKNIGKDGEQQGPKEIGMKCPDCKEGKVVIRRVSKGRARGKHFWGCSKYPDCKYASWDDPTKPKEEKPASSGKNNSTKAKLQPKTDQPLADATDGKKEPKKKEESKEE